jgi:PKD repeat protein
MTIRGDALQDQAMVFDASDSWATAYDRPRLLYHWDLGDGTQAIGSVVTHAYTLPGTYLVRLTVTDPQGSSDSTEAWVEVQNVPPQGLLSIAYRASQGQVIRLEALVTDTVSDMPRLSYRWILEDGELRGRSVAVAFEEPGRHVLTVQATDGYEVVEVSVPVYVESAPPFAHVPSVFHYGPNRPVRLEAQMADSPVGIQSLTFLWRVGGRQEISGNPAYHWYPSTGVYAAQLIVRDQWGAEFFQSFTVTVTYDEDGDGLPRELEVYLGTNDGLADTDGDGLLDGSEHLGLRGYTTDPALADTDGDGLWDGFNITVAGTPRIGERSMGTDPLNPDTDGDWLEDGLEVEGWTVEVTRGGESTSYAVSSNPLLPDGDEDGLTDYQEWFLGSDPGEWDTDGDGLWDDEDPAVRNDDADGDRVSDALDRLPTSSASLNFKTQFPPGFVRFRQVFSVFSVEGIVAWVYNYYDGGCYFIADETEEATRSSVVNETTVTNEIVRTFEEGGELNYTPTNVEYVTWQSTSFERLSYGECTSGAPKRYNFTYAIVEDKWAVDMVNVEEVEVPDGFGGLYEFAVHRIPVRKGHPVSLVLQYSIPEEDDRSFYVSDGEFRVSAFGYTVFAQDAATEEALYANTAVATGLEEGSYQAQIKIPGSVTSQASEDADGRAFLTILLLPFWLEVHPFYVKREAWATGSVIWASLGLEIPVYAYQVIAKLSVDLEDLESYLPESAEEVATGVHDFGPYRVYAYDVDSNQEFDESLLANVDAVILLGISEFDIISTRQSIDWGSAGVWYEEQSDQFNEALKWFRTVERAGRLSLRFMRFKDMLQLELGGAVAFPALPSDPGERDVSIEIRKVRQGGETVYIQRRISTVDDVVAVGGGYKIISVRKSRVVGIFTDLDEIEALQGRRATMRGALRGAAIGVILVTWGRTGIVAYMEGDVIRGTVYTAATAASIFGTVFPRVTLGEIGISGLFSKVSVAKISTAVVGAILASYYLYLASQSNDPIKQLSNLERAGAIGIDTIILFASAQGPLIYLAWTITVALMFIVMPDNVAASIMSSPGTLVTFLFEYTFGGSIPSAISEDAFENVADKAIYRMRQWNRVFNIPSVVVLPQEE